MLLNRRKVFQAVAAMALAPKLIESIPVKAEGHWAKEFANWHDTLVNQAFYRAEWLGNGWYALPAAEQPSYEATRYELVNPTRYPGHSHFLTISDRLIHSRPWSWTREQMMRTAEMHERLYGGKEALRELSISDAVTITRSAPLV